MRLGVVSKGIKIEGTEAIYGNHIKSNDLIYLTVTVLDCGMFRCAKFVGREQKISRKVPLLRFPVWNS